MFAIIALLSVGAMIWWFMSPSLAFVQGFARLIDNPSTTRLAMGFPRFKSSTTGQFNGRTVTLTLIHPARHSPGEGIVAMSTSAPGGEPWKDTTLTRANPDVSRATFDLEGKYGLILTLAGGQLQATWSRRGIMFPGPFDEAVWRNTLVQMETIARWMEARDRRS